MATKEKSLQFGEPFSAYTAIEGVANKGHTKWTRCLFLGKSNLNDMCICGCEGRLQLTRSVRRNVVDWAQNSGLYMNFSVAPWNVSVVIGSKLLPEVKKSISEPIGLEMESFGLQTPFSSGFQTPRLSLARRRRQAPKTPGPVESPRDEAASDAPPSSLSMSPSIAPSFVESDGEPKSPVHEQAGTSSSPSKRAATEEEQHERKKQVSMPSDVPKPVRLDTPERAEPETTKRHKEESRKHQKTRRVEVEPAHHDLNDFSEWFDVDPESVDSCEASGGSMNYTFDPEAVQPEELTFRCSEHDPEPALDMSVLEELDRLADQVEVSRLLDMGVLLRDQNLTEDQRQEFEKGLNKSLSAKFVRTWRPKFDDKGFYWLRRSRAVVREFQFLEEREDVYSPASSSSLVRLLPAMLVSGQFPKHWVLCSFDVSDAYLMVPQENIRWTNFVDNGESYVIARCLPGQRDGAKRWFNFSLLISKKSIS
jgi:hypothetical protein